MRKGSSHCRHAEAPTKTLFSPVACTWTSRSLRLRVHGKEADENDNGVSLQAGAAAEVVRGQQHRRQRRQPLGLERSQEDESKDIHLHALASNNKRILGTASASTHFIGALTVMHLNKQQVASTTAANRTRTWACLYIAPTLPC